MVDRCPVPRDQKYAFNRNECMAPADERRLNRGCPCSRTHRKVDGTCIGQKCSENSPALSQYESAAK